MSLKSDLIGSMWELDDYQLMVFVLRKIATKLNIDGKHSLAAEVIGMATDIEAMNKKGKTK